MATHTLATNAALTAVTFSPQRTILLPADLATISQLIAPANASGLPAIYGSFTREGMLMIPGRKGTLEVFPGDVIAVDGTGWPILLSAKAAASAAAWTYT